MVAGHEVDDNGGPGAWGRIRNPDGTVRNEPVPTTQFPQAVGLGETRDVDVLRRVAEIEGREARSSGAGQWWRTSTN